MNDFFNTSNSLQHSPIYIKEVFQSIYGWEPTTSVFLGINLRWPEFNLPNNYPKYFLSWHTEQLDIFWLQQQSKLVYPHPILVAYDGKVDSSIFLDNVKFVRWITWHLQLDQLVKLFGACAEPQLPKYKISSLSFRISQYKNYVTAYLLKHACPDELLLSYHAHLGKEEDRHGYPNNIPWLDDLDINGLVPIWINFQDNFSVDKNQPVSNGNWLFAPYQDALVNLTNESFHYTRSELNGQSFVYPSPYMTEKTWKPLLAGRPFLSVAQWHVYQELSTLGLQFDFGFPQEFDQDSGDLTRIRDIFKSIDAILSQSTEQLYEQSLPSVKYNVRAIVSGDFGKECQMINQQTKKIITDFIN